MYVYFPTPRKCQYHLHWQKGVCRYIDVEEIEIRYFWIIWIDLNPKGKKKKKNFMRNRREDTEIDGRSRKDKDADWRSVVTCHKASLMAQMVKTPPAMWETWVQSLGWEDPWRRTGNPFQCSCLENPTDRGAWRATVHVVANSWTRLSNQAYTVACQGTLGSCKRLRNEAFPSVSVSEDVTITSDCSHH